MRATVWLACIELVICCAAVAGTKNKPLTCPDDIAWTGEYTDYSYGFAIIIPKGVKGFWNSPRCGKKDSECTCMSDHGRIIPLAAMPNGPDRQIEAYAGYASDLETGTLSEAIASNLEWIRDSSEDGSMSVVRKTKIRLSSLPAERYVVRYRDKKSKTWMVEDFTEAMRKA